MLARKSLAPVTVVRSILIPVCRSLIMAILQALSVTIAFARSAPALEIVLQT